MIKKLTVILLVLFLGLFFLGSCSQEVKEDPLTVVKLCGITKPSEIWLIQAEGVKYMNIQKSVSIEMNEVFENLVSEFQTVEIQSVQEDEPENNYFLLRIIGGLDQDDKEGSHTVLKFKADDFAHFWYRGHCFQIVSGSFDFSMLEDVDDPSIYNFPGMS